MKPPVWSNRDGNLQAAAARCLVRMSSRLRFTRALRAVGPPAAEPQSRPRFAPHTAFTRDLDTAVEAYFAGGDRRRRQRDLPAMYLKSVLILGWLVASWTYLVFVA